MRSAVLGLLLITAPAFAGTLDQPILGGTKTTAGQFPNVVAIEVNGGLCTGTLIDKDWVLTAAHCLENVSPTGARVHFGTLTFSGGTIVTSSMVFANPMYSTFGSSDIGLIKLSKSVTDITPVPVNLIAAKAPVGIKVTMVGYGATVGGNQNTAGTEYVVEQTSTTCTPYKFSDANLLCYNQTTGKGKCQGDSGGPSFAMIDGRLTQVGITSFGDQNCAQFGADTRTDVEREFIQSHVPICSTDADCPDGRTCFLQKCIAQPFGPGGLGATCTADMDCDSGTCAASGDDHKCSTLCTVGDATACPDGLECVAPGACWPAEDGGCCDASGGNATSMLLGMALFGLVVSRKRRR